MKKTGDDKKKISSMRMLRRILEFLKPYAKLFVLSIFLNIIFSTFDAITIASIKPVFQIIFPAGEEQPQETKANDGGTELIPTPEALANLKDSLYEEMNNFIDVPGDKEGSLINLGIFIILAFVFKNIFKYLSSLVSLKLQEGVIKSIRDKVFAKLTSLPVGFFSKSRTGNLISIITNDVTALNNSTISSFTTLLRESTKIILFLIILFAISTNLSLIAFSTSIISLLIIRLAMKYIRRYASRMQTAMADYTSTLQESISGMKVVKAYNAEVSANNRFFSDTARYVKSAIKHKKIIAVIPSINEIFAIMALCVVLFIGGVQVIRGDMPPDELMTFLFALFAIMNPIALVINAFSNFQLGYVAAGRVFSVLDEDEEKETGKEEIKSFNDSIEIQGIDFAYDDGAVIKDVSLKIKKCSKVAFVGASGSGKSTMLDLIVRFYDPVQGNIMIDNRNIKDYTLHSYRSLFGIVAQESILFNDSLANNIKFGKPEASAESVEEAAKVSNAHGFISKLPGSYDTPIGDRGVMLSGGERQRVSIARALVRDPEILIFDEATSALDSESEKIVQEAINDSLKNRTAIIVAHRLATIIDCDEIFVFDRGKVVESGNHAELIETGGIYKKLYDIQFAGNSLV